MTALTVLLVGCFLAFATAHPFNFPGAPWHTDISSAALDANSANIISTLSGQGGWGTGASNFRIDFSIPILYANSSTPMFPVTQASGYYSDCDTLTGGFPVPPGGAIENYPLNPYGTTCSGDCHYIVYHQCTNTLYESYQTQITAPGATNGLTSGCAIAWDVSRTYPSNLRGDQCTSCDAAGYPIGPLLWSADEVKSGVINHAIRFILPNNRIQRGKYQHPATHGGCDATSTTCNSGTNAIMYGQRLRLKSSFSLTQLTQTPQSPYINVIITALKKYGMFLSDGGNVPLTAASDSFTTYKWTDVSIDSFSLAGITVNDFEVVDQSGLGAVQTLTFNCVKNSFAVTPFIGPDICGSSSSSTSMSASTTPAAGSTTGTSTAATDLINGTSKLALGLGIGLGVGIPVLLLLLLLICCCCGCIKCCKKGPKGKNLSNSSASSGGGSSAASSAASSASGATGSTGTRASTKSTASSEV